MKETATKKLTPSEISTFCAQISMILKSGITMADGVEIMYGDMENPGGKEVLKVILDHVEVGEPLFMALEATGRFPKYMLDMVQIGEQSGRLDEVMDNLCEYYEREENISQSIRHAITYPAVMIVMMLLVIGVLVVKVLPIFNQVYQQLGSEMSGFAQGIMNAGSLVGQYSIAILAVLAVLVLGFLGLRATEKGRHWLRSFKDTFFVTKKLSAKIATGRFASAMNLMLSSGLDTDHSLEMAENMVDHGPVHEKISACRKMVEQGEALADSLEKTGLFIGVYARMISVGFKTGAVDVVMKKVADRYEKEVDGQISSMIGILEPTLVAVLSIIVGMILLSVMLPLMGIMSSIG